MATARPSSTISSSKKNQSSGTSSSTSLTNTQHRLSSFFTMSEHTRDHFYTLIATGKTAIQYGWIPFIVFLGTLRAYFFVFACVNCIGVGFMRSEPRPSLIRLLNPLA